MNQSKCIIYVFCEIDALNGYMIHFSLNLVLNQRILMSTISMTNSWRKIIVKCLRSFKKWKRCWKSTPKWNQCLMIIARQCRIRSKKMVHIECKNHNIEKQKYNSQQNSIKHTLHFKALISCKVYCYAMQQILLVYISKLIFKI